MAKLTDKQELFCREYLIDLNATQAAIRAGYSEKTARQIAEQNLSKLDIQTYIQSLKQDRNERNKIDADYVLRRLVEIDQMDVADILADDLSLKPITEWPKCWRQTLQGVDIVYMASSQDVETLIKKIKWPDKVKNLELLGKHVDVQAFKEKVSNELTGKDGGPIQYSDITDEDLNERLKELGHGRHKSQLEEKLTDS